MSLVYTTGASQRWRGPSMERTNCPPPLQCPPPAHAHRILASFCCLVGSGSKVCVWCVCVWCVCVLGGEQSSTGTGMVVLNPVASVKLLWTFQRFDVDATGTRCAFYGPQEEHRIFDLTRLPNTVWRAGQLHGWLQVQGVDGCGCCWHWRPSLPYRAVQPMRAS